MTCLVSSWRRQMTGRWPRRSNACFGMRHLEGVSARRRGGASKSTSTATIARNDWSRSSNVTVQPPTDANTLMCGIAGFVVLHPRQQVSGPLGAMIGTLRHRGPDDEGEYCDGSVALGHRRLSIIDLTRAGHQPMSNADGSIWLTYNGEIYNYRELDAELKSRGYAYRSRSDTETIVHAYEEWGADCVHRFNGMFAFALWDGRRRRLFCARDRFGEKPFYYAVQRDRVVFASEIKALLADPSVSRAPDFETIARYLEHNVSDGSTSTFFAAIKSLAPAHTLIVESGRLTSRYYWRPPSAPFRAARRSDDDWIAEFGETFRSSVELRLRSDVPVGTCLSGGLDSSSIICLTSRITAAPVPAFSVVYDEPGFREGQFVRQVADAVRLDAHTVTPSGADLLDTMAAIVRHNDEPSTSYGQYSQWHVMKLAADHGVPVLLNGQGGDELLGGYDRYLPTYVRELALSGRVRQSARELGAAGGSLRRNLKQVVYPLIAPAMREAYRTSVTRQWHPRDYLAADFAAAWANEPWSPRAPSTLREHLVHDLTVASLPALVHQEDRMSMAFSREIRLPFLDPRLVELVLQMPSSLKIRDGVRKHVLRRAMTGEAIPPAILDRRDKKGYPTPVGLWLRTIARSAAGDVLLSTSLRRRGIVNVEKACAAYETHVRGAADFTQPIWQWLSLELWFRQFVDHAVSMPADAAVAISPAAHAIPVV